MISREIRGWFRKTLRKKMWVWISVFVHDAQTKILVLGKLVTFSLFSRKFEFWGFLTKFVEKMASLEHSLAPPLISIISFQTSSNWTSLLTWSVSKGKNEMENIKFQDFAMWIGWKFGWFSKSSVTTTYFIGIDRIAYGIREIIHASEIY